MYEFIGTVSEVCATQTFPSGFTKRELVVAEDGSGNWVNDVTFNFKKEAIAKIAAVRQGDRVKVAFALDGRAWTDPRTSKVRHFSDLVGLGVEVLSRAPGAPAAAPAAIPEVDDGTPF